MNIFLVILIAVSLSMDAFSLSLAYGTLGISKKDKRFLSIITGVFHFVMPLIGMCFGRIILNFIKVDYDVMVAIILSFIGIEMIISSFKDGEEIKLIRLRDFFLFAFAVSIDSFSVGITFTEISENVFISIFVFALISYFFTYLGLSIGNKIAKYVGKMSTLLGGLVLISIGIYHIV